MDIPASLAALTANFSEVRQAIFCFAVGGFIRGAHNMVIHGPSPSKTVTAMFLTHALHTTHGEDIVEAFFPPFVPGDLHARVVTSDPAPLAPWRSERTQGPDEGLQFGQKELIVQNCDDDYIADSGVNHLLAGPVRLGDKEYAAWNAPVLMTSNTPLQETKDFVAAHAASRPLIVIHMPPIPRADIDTTLMHRLRHEMAEIITYCVQLYEALANAGDV